MLFIKIWSNSNSVLRLFNSNKYTYLKHHRSIGFLSNTLNHNYLRSNCALWSKNVAFLKSENSINIYCATLCTNNEKPASTKQKLATAVKDYGVTVIIFHVSISLLSLGLFYLAVYSGLDVPAVLSYTGLHMNEKLTAITSGTSTFVIAYAIHKVFAPVRISITLAAAPFLVRYLKRIGILRRYLATGNSFRSIAFSYRLGESTVGRIVEEVCDVLWKELQPMVLPTPTMETWLKTAAEFQKKWNFNNCVGAIDGKHVTIRKPIKSGSAYFNYKKNFSIVLMAVVDADYKFLIIDEGSYGRFSDGNIFANSNFGNALKNNTLDLPEDSCLINGEEKMPYVFVADEAFPLMEHLMRPYPRVELNEPKKVFNYRLSRARRTVESAFGILAARWRVYLKPFEIHVNKVDKVVKATCVLHNYLRSKKKSGEPVEEEIEDLGGEVPKDQLLPARHVGFNASSTAFAIRQKFTDFFVSSAGSTNWQVNSIEEGHF